jgi:hypothetical protein
MMSCRTGPLREGRSLRDVYIFFVRCQMRGSGLRPVGEDL